MVCVRVLCLERYAGLGIILCPVSTYYELYCPGIAIFLMKAIDRLLKKLNPYNTKLILYEYEYVRNKIIVCSHKHNYVL
jgi:hypothetical protein